MIYLSRLTHERIVILILLFIIIVMTFLLVHKDNQNQVSNNPIVPIVEVKGTTTPVVKNTNDIKKNKIIDKIINIIPKSNKNVSLNPSNLNTVMAWIYPGEPACRAFSELKDGREIDVLKVEYFRINSEGGMDFLDEKNSGCNAYSVASLQTIKNYSREQYVTVASVDSNLMAIFIQEDAESNTYTDRLVNFVVNNNLTGIEIDFEDYGGWDASLYNGYKEFIKRLGTELHEKNKKLIIDGPAVSNSIEEKWYVWRYEDFVTLPVDYVLVMAYDYQFDHGVGEPVSPINWIEKVIDWTSSKFTDKSRLVIGVPSYGYYGTIGQNKQIIVTYDQILKYPGFDTAKRDEKSGEMMWKHGNNFYVYQDSISMNMKIKAILNKGIGNISVWHLGGNNWFTE